MPPSARSPALVDGRDVRDDGRAAHGGILADGTGSYVMGFRILATLAAIGSVLVVLARRPLRHAVAVAAVVAAGPRSARVPEA